ncbi:uncharacterized protein RAG0_03245 [Rhynchosporium agropyri]|uniref:Uncharacterized protein n=2 Tax=Rhynchosporium TaxID=38037 RepID=A0A1E1K3P2_9HELO|nr:uncharacterized protein RAG0_03245 [Rhynchosporium agropyri]CZS96578.1 uncharacterized protein RCO7_14417 [Rhynchosporium commune]
MPEYDAAYGDQESFVHELRSAGDGASCKEELLCMGEEGRWCTWRDDWEEEEGGWGVADSGDSKEERGVVKRDVEAKGEENVKGGRDRESENEAIPLTHNDDVKIFFAD